MISADPSGQPEFISASRHGIYLPEEERLFLLKSWARLLQAGIPMNTALDDLARSTRRRALQAALFRARSHLEAGAPFAQAMADSGLFPATWVALLNVSWTRGDIGPLLDRLQQRIQETQRIKQELVSALIMPALILVLVVAWVWVFLTRVAPTLAILLSEWTSSLWLLALLAEVATWGFFAGVAGMGVIVILLVISWRARRSHQIMGPLQSRIPTWVPVLGPMVSRMHLIIIASELQLQLEVGVPVMTAVEILRHGVSNEELQKDLHIVYERLRAGLPISVALGGVKILSPIAIPLLTAGELSGKIPDMLGVVVREAEYDLQAYAKRLVIVVKSLAVLVSGLIVSAIALAFFLLVFYSMGAIAQGASSSSAAAPME